MPKCLIVLQPQDTAGVCGGSMYQPKARLLTQQRSVSMDAPVNLPAKSEMTQDLRHTHFKLTPPMAESFLKCPFQAVLVGNKDEMSKVASTE